MTPKEKARELVNEFRLNVVDYEGSGLNDFKAKQSALIAVDEILKSKSLGYLFTKDEIYSMESTSDDRCIYDRFTEYWEEVKHEIQKL
jgi:hypothetical protein